MTQPVPKNAKSAKKQADALLATAAALPDVLERIRRVCARVSEDDWLHQKVMKSVMTELAKAELKRSPTEILYNVLGHAMKMLGSADPYLEEKAVQRDTVSALAPDLEQRVRASDDPLRAAAQLAIAANIIDPPMVDAFDAKAELAEALDRPLAVDDYAPMREALDSADHVLYLLGGTAEALVDRLLLAEIKRLGKPLTVVARKSALLFAATEAEAQDMDLQEFSDIINPGGDMLGIVVAHTSPEFREAFRGADVVIAKDQTHFETLYGADREIFFLFRVKTSLVAERLSVDLGASALLRRRPL